MKLGCVAVLCLALGTISAPGVWAAQLDRCTASADDLDFGDHSPQVLDRAFKDAPPIARGLGPGRRALLAKLLDRGESPEACLGAASVLAVAAQMGDVTAARMLLDGGARVDRPLDSGGGTPLFTALAAGRYDVAALLLDRGADPLHASEGGSTALHELAMADVPAQPEGRQHQRDWATRLIGLGLAVDVRNQRGATPLMWATVRQNRGLADHLLAQGADPDAQDQRGTSPASIARKRGDADWQALFDRARAAPARP